MSSKQMLWLRETELTLLALGLPWLSFLALRLSSMAMLSWVEEWLSARRVSSWVLALYPELLQESAALLAAAEGPSWAWACPRMVPLVAIQAKVVPEVDLAAAPEAVVAVAAVEVAMVAAAGAEAVLGRGSWWQVAAEESPGQEATCTCKHTCRAGQQDNPKTLAPLFPPPPAKLCRGA